MARRKTHEEFVREVHELVGDEYIFITKYKNMRTKVKLEHKKCGYVRDVFPQTILRKSDCPYCTGGARLTHEDFVKKVQVLGGDEYEVMSAFTRMHDNILMLHKKCGVKWELKPYYFMQGSRCPTCANEEKSKRFSKGREKFVKELETLWRGEYTLIGEYKNAHTRTLFRHNDCGTEWESEPNNVLKGHGCVVCSGSSGERRVLNYLKTTPFDYELEYTLDGCKHERLLPFDFAVFKDKKLLCLIEYNGGQHYDPVELWGGIDNLKEIQLRDQIKRDYCKENHIPLIEIPYWDYKNIDNILSEELENLISIKSDTERQVLT